MPVRPGKYGRSISSKNTDESFSCSRRRQTFTAGVRVYPVRELSDGSASSMQRRAWHHPAVLDCLDEAPGGGTANVALQFREDVWNREAERENFGRSERLRTLDTEPDGSD
jgi:hypothetical protein